MVSLMRLLLLFVLALATVPVALAVDNPGPAAVAACQAEAAQLGKDAFVAKYGPSEPFGHCYAAHAAAAPTTTTATTEAPPDSPALAACKAEYAQLGKDAFVAKYGTTETLGHCVAAHNAPKPAPEDSPAVAACKAEYAQLGKDAFLAKYGTTETLGRCVAAQQHAAKPDPKAACLAEAKKHAPGAVTDKRPAACVKAPKKTKR